MSKYVILLTDAHEAPAFELIEALRSAGVKTLIEGLRDVEIEAELTRLGKRTDELQGPPPLAVLYEVVPGADIVELRAAVAHAKTFWPGAPLVACRRQTNGYLSLNLRNLDGASLKRLGFRAIADKAAQLPALLHEVEGPGVTAELKLPEKAQGAFGGSASLPEKLNAKLLRAAFDLISALHFIGDQTSAAQTAVSGMESLVPADRWTIFLLSDSKTSVATVLESIATHKYGDKTDPFDQDWRRFLLNEGGLAPGSESKSTVRAAAGMGTIKKKEQNDYVVAVPLICGERILGVLEGRRTGKYASTFKKREVNLLDALARPLASALANSVRIAEAERLSQTDDLTKLHNARYLRQFLLNEIRRARRYGSSVAALFLDLDDFKRINDIHGHLVGSHVLMEMAGVILSSIRDTDAVARYGGDEFVIVLPDTATELAGAVAERIREKISHHEFNGGRRLKLKLTASFGVAAFPEHASSPQQLIACADSAMYEAKAAQKNCVRFATGLVQSMRDENNLPDDLTIAEIKAENLIS
ncbi:MAG TPA: sensor domain-containing diguanylate cyclase [Pyrinomonadaceae bacterium]|nr:sensor domain-containing diguanylate cyclase [Pyrinomonadaceae bacterium]